MNTRILLHLNDTENTELWLGGQWNNYSLPNQDDKPPIFENTWVVMPDSASVFLFAFRFFATTCRTEAFVFIVGVGNIENLAVTSDSFKILCFSFVVEVAIDFPLWKPEDEITWPWRIAVFFQKFSNFLDLWLDLWGSLSLDRTVWKRSWIDFVEFIWIWLDKTAKSNGSIWNTLLEQGSDWVKWGASSRWLSSSERRTPLY